MQMKIKALISKAPPEIPEDAIKTILRILQSPNVIGAFYIRNGIIGMSALPESMLQIFTKRLPVLVELVDIAVKEITVDINRVNPIIDRLMDDDSVQSVVMTNNQGTPILTSTSLTNANALGVKSHRLGDMAYKFVKNMDPYDEILMLRVKTKKLEIMIAPHLEYNIIVVQNSRENTTRKKEV